MYCEVPVRFSITQEDQLMSNTIDVLWGSPIDVLLLLMYCGVPVRFKYNTRSPIDVQILLMYCKEVQLMH